MATVKLRQPDRSRSRQKLRRLLLIRVSLFGSAESLAPYASYRGAFRESAAFQFANHNDIVIPRSMPALTGGATRNLHFGRPSTHSYSGTRVVSMISARIASACSDFFRVEAYRELT